MKIKLPPEWGTEPVPAEKKIMRVIDYFVLWSSLAVGLLVLQAGGLLIPGLSLVQVLAISLMGSILGSLMLASAGGLGSKYGIPTMVSLRAVLGLRGSYLPTILNITQLIGWASFEILVMADAALLAGQFLGDSTRYFWILVFASWCLLLSLGGPLVVIRQWLEKFAIWLTYGTTIFLTYMVVTRFPENLSFAGDGSLPLTLALDLVIAMPISWWPLISDYNRFSKSEKSAFSGTLSGYSFANFWFYSLGALLTLAYGTGIVESIMAVTFGALALTILVVDETDNGFADIYSAAVSVQNIAPKLRQWKLITAITITSILIAVFLPQQWHIAYESFLLYIGAIFVPLLGVLFADFYLLKKRKYKVDEFYSSSAHLRVRPLGAWFIGIITYFLLYTYTTLGSSIPSFVVSALILLALEKVK